ncbi:MAG: carbohydrate-binding family 9-like protein [Bacteroidota bacterium]
MKHLLKLLLFVFISFILACNQPETGSTYKVHKTKVRPEINAVWDKIPWNKIKPLQIQNHMGERPEHFPFTQAKITYDDSAVYVIFRVEDRYVKAVTKKNQGPVFTDSCVEFFFSPDDSTRSGYFNLEMNCGGTMLFHHQSEPRTNQNHISEAHIEEIEVAHTLPVIVDPEIQEETTWSVEYRIPFSMLNNYDAFPNPESGTIWRANLYKCADKTSHPHWITWAPVDLPKPDFHQPEFFGILEFQ